MLVPASGTGRFYRYSPKVIRFLLQGCTNRPFYHIVVTETRRPEHYPVIEQLGTYDPLPNQHGEKLVSLNLERIGYWLGQGVDVSKPVSQLFGLSGLLPVHPTSFIGAWRNRLKKEKEDLEKTEGEKAENANVKDEITT